MSAAVLLFSVVAGSIIPSHCGNGLSPSTLSTAIFNGSGLSKVNGADEEAEKANSSQMCPIGSGLQRDSFIEREVAIARGH